MKATRTGQEWPHGFDPRVLPSRPVLGLAEYEQAGGGQGLEAAARLGPDGVIDEITASGLRGRGGAGFPTGRKWAAVSGNVSPVEPTTVVVNAAEGEPGSFKDRSIMRADPYRVSRARSSPPSRSAPTR